MSSKYKNIKTGGYDSRKEAERAAELKLMEKAGLITKLEQQQEFLLIDKQKDEAGKVIERACKYRADFVYLENEELVVEDVKGIKTPDYIIKRKLMLKQHGIRVREV